MSAGQIIGGPSQKYSGIIDLRSYQLLVAGLEKLETELKEAKTKITAIEAKIVTIEAAIKVLEELKTTKGTVSLKWTASTDSAIVKVKHGLGKKPSLVLATYGQAFGAGQIVVVSAFNVTATEFETAGRVNGAVTGEVVNAVNWVAFP